jgi:hypothetical protein
MESGCGCVVEGGVRVRSCGTSACRCLDLPERSTIEVAQRIRRAFETNDMDTFHELLAPDARWGDDDAPNRCRGREDVIRTFKRLLDQGVRGTLEDTTAGPNGIAARLRVEWPAPADSASEVLFQVYVLHDEHIIEIRRYDDEPSALAASSH